MLSEIGSSQPTSGDEKRVKLLEPVPGWDLTKKTTHFSWMVIIILDGKPLGLGFRCSEREFVTPYHMGPVSGKKLEIAGVEDYEDNLEDCKAQLNPNEVTITALDYNGVRSKTGYDQIMVEVGKVPFAKAGISRYPHGYDKSIQGEVLALGFDMSSADVWKPLVVHRGEMCNTPCFTASTGTVLHTVNTEGGWSGAPLVRMVGGKATITAMHIAGVPGPALYNVAVSANLVERMVRAKDSTYVPSWNCPFSQMQVIKVDEDDEEVLFCLDEKSTNKMMATAAKRADRARRGKAKGKQLGARQSRKGFPGWKQTNKKKPFALGKMSSANYDKLKQAASMGGNNPEHAHAVRATYGKLMRLQAQIEHLRRYGEGPADNEELGRLEASQDAIVRNFQFDAEARMRAAMRNSMPRAAASSSARWADVSDDEDEEYEEPPDDGGFYDESRLHYHSVLWEKTWAEHDPDFESTLCDEARDKPVDVFATKCSGDQPWVPHLTPSLKKAINQIGDSWLHTCILTGQEYTPMWKSMTDCPGRNDNIQDTPSKAKWHSPACPNCHGKDSRRVSC